MPPIQKSNVVPKKQTSKVWRYFGDNLDGVIAKCPPCKYNPTKGDPINHHWNDENITSLSSPFLPSSSKWRAASSKSERVTPKKAKLNPEKEEDLAVVKCNMRLLKAWASETKLLPY